MKCAPACALECGAPGCLRFRDQVLLRPACGETHTACRRSRAGRNQRLRLPPASAHRRRDRRANGCRRRTGSSNCFLRQHGCRVRDHQWGRTRRPGLDPLSRKRKKQRPPADDEAIDVESLEPQFCKTREGSGVTGNPRSFHSGNPPSSRAAL